MDIEIPKEELNRQVRKRIIKIAALVTLVVAAFFGFRSFIFPSVDYRSLQTDVIRKGSITASLTASGRVVPEYEQMIISPLQARIDSVYHGAGAMVKAGTPILKLDLNYTRLELERLQEGLQKKKNEATLIRLRMEKNLADLQARHDIQQLRIRSLESSLEDEKHLVSIGGGTPENVRQAELDLKVSQRELQQLAEQINNQQQTNKADMDALGFEIRIQEKSINELRQRMEQAEIRVEQDGVIVFVKDQKGASVQAGEELVRLADLSRFKVEARISEAYAGVLSPGGMVKVKAGGAELSGMISSIQPEVQNGQVAFEVSLEKPDASMLRPGLQVDVLVVTDYKNNTLIVKNGSFFKGKEDQKVFIVEGGQAIAKMVDIGLSNMDYVEVKGLKEGDELIISDMSEYEQADEVQLQNL